MADLPVDQLAVFQGGAHHLIAPAGQGIQQLLEIARRHSHLRPALKDDPVIDLWVSLSCLAATP